MYLQGGHAQSEIAYKTLHYQVHQILKGCHLYSFQTTMEKKGTWSLNEQPGAIENILIIQ